VKPGQPFSYGSILEAQRNLYRLGIFNRVDVQPEQSGTSLSERNVVIQVEEGRNLTVSGSLGIRARRGGETGENDISPRVALAVAHRNLFGTGRYIGLEGIMAGNNEEREAFLTYREPFIGRYNVPVQVSVFQTDDATVKERRILQRGTSIEASKVAFLRTRWSLQYQYKISKCETGQICRDVAAGIPVPELDRSLLDIQISSITPTFFWDKRDDIVDPHRGFFTSASVEYAFKLFSADARFTKEFVQGAWYLPVSQRSVFVMSARVGLIQSRGSTFGLNSVPLSERFMGGGDTSHRAYPLDLLGTLCTDSGNGDFLDDPKCRVVTIGDRQAVIGATLYDLDNRPGKFRLAPIGGNSMFVMNVEYRFPIFASVGGAVFVDAGNVFAADTIRFGDLRYGVGGGVRYLSPVGPLRLDVGMPLSRRVYDRAFVYSVTLGFPF
jgi:outer membrane protein assembly factor BamA